MSRRENQRQTIKEDLYIRKEKEEIKNIENVSAELLQELLNICNSLSQKVNQEKEETIKGKVNFIDWRILSKQMMLAVKFLVIDEIK
ncbi:hypothetical protein F8M41_011380 [Gigaspora margarita]|uniref:Uncharacterized protein n=1 Tax=Gigaspora margarita TaxID=4874 RepID=A0A8H3X150_GIGMA|nr:hypothetical protein F8M41_011380 [Gigaspora margarita]